MDDLPEYSTVPLFKLYSNEKLKVLFNPPYMSPSNIVELCFRHIKRETYSHLYSSIKELKENIIKKLNEDAFKKK